MFKRISLMAIALVLVVGLLSSCSKEEYLNAIPEESQMLIRFNTTKISGAKSPLILKSLLRVSNIDDTGLDLSSDVFFFEDAQANLGLCAKVSDADKLASTLKGAGLKITKKRDYQFAALSSGWVIGFSDGAALLMGPVVVSQQSELMSLMARYLGSDEESGIKSSPLYDKADSIDAPMVMVAQTKALPEQFVAPFTLGAPRDSDPADIILAASMEVKDGRLLMSGNTYSLKKSINKALNDSRKIFRPIKGNYVKSMSADDVMGMFLNVDGKQFHSVLTQNRSVSGMLAGINAAIDLDNIIKSVDGDMTLISSSLGKDDFDLKMSAKLSGAPWLKDVDYWKESVPEGGRIGDWGKNSFYYTGGGTTYYFGVTPDMQYMSGGSAAEAVQSIKASTKPIDAEMQKMIIGKKMVMIVNFSALKGGKADAVTALLRPMFGNVKTIVYTMK